MLCNSPVPRGRPCLLYDHTNVILRVVVKEGFYCIINGISPNIYHFSDCSCQVVIQWTSKNLCALHPMWIVPHAHTLTQLDLSSNHIQRLPDMLPWQLESLEKLDVSSNQLHAFMDGGTEGKILCLRFVQSSSI